MTCCRGGRSSLDGGVVAQLSLNAVGSLEARLWREEGGGGLAEGGLLRRRGRGLAFAFVRLPITRTRVLGSTAGNCGGGGREVRGQHLPGVTRLRRLANRRLLLLDGRSLEDRQRAEAAACGGHQRGSQGGLPMGTGPGVTVWKKDRSNESQLTNHGGAAKQIGAEGRREGPTFSDWRKDVQTGPAHDRLAFPVPGQHLQVAD